MDNKYIIALLKCKGIGNTRLFEFIKEQDFNIDKIKINLNKLISNDDYNNFIQILSDAEYEIEANEKKEIKLITILDEKFPSKLYTISDPVLYLYYKGNIDLINTLSVAIIGTRNPNELSKENSYKLSSNLSKQGYTIISGLALGIDAIAHKSCVENKGKTIAVLPSGIDNIQPTSNRGLAEEIINSNGCLVSEYPIETVLNKFNYAKRDRIQSALSNVIIVPEANEKSGTMIAVNKSKKEGKPVFQLTTNNNKLIDNSIDIEKEDYLYTIKRAVELDVQKEKQKELDIINSKMNNEQISLFDF
ncbi:MAG: DNA-processing protein DprA [Firmicutes bacterium]|nr:DNA-processing protein DprA [Bacillota bacterium]